jgi:hypothetical protein
LEAAGLQNDSLITTDGSGRPISPATGIFPILLELELGVLKVVGTAFYITRYGLFLSAAHVMFDAFDKNNKQRGRLFGLHAANDYKYNLRPVLRFDSNYNADIALGELDNFKNEHPENPLENKIGILQKRRPVRGDFLSTYAYPDNEPFDFRDRDVSRPRPLHADYYSGHYRRFLKDGEYHAGHFEMSIRIGNGASGGPVFHADGGICGIAARGWDLLHEDFGDDQSSYAVPIAECMGLGLSDLLVPDHWWERRQMPSDVASRKFTVQDLVGMGHVLVR